MWENDVSFFDLLWSENVNKIMPDSEQKLKTEKCKPFRDRKI